MAQATPWVPIISAKHEIRLLDLAPKFREPNELSCDLRVVSLDDKPAYEALSYVWGEKTDPPHVLFVGGHTLTITKNLFEALHSLRWDDEIRTLWVDAVCIRQEDDEERSWQVSMMGDIYKNSAMVLIWLGSGDLDQNLSAGIHLHISDREKHFKDLPKMNILDHTRESWWRRAWTLQEAVLGPSLSFCSGKERCSAAELQVYCHRVLKHFFQDYCCQSLLMPFPWDSNVNAILDTLSQLLRLFELREAHRREASTDLLRLTLDHRDRNTSNPRDKVFAFVGMANRNSVPQDLVQYNLPVLETMVSTAFKLLQKTDTLEVIRYATSPLAGEEDFSDQDRNLQRAGAPAPIPPRLQDLPSWCPDWTQDVPTEILRIMQTYREEMHGRFGAGIAHQANVKIYGGQRLGVTGIKCDRVIHVGGWNRWLFHGSEPELTKTLRQWCYILAYSLAFHTARCDGCGRRIYGIRFKCLGCKDFDYCCRCMQKPPGLHAAEHKFLLNYFGSSELQRNGEGWSELIKESTWSNTELQSFPGLKEEIENDGSFWASGSLWEQLLDVEYPFTNGDSLQEALRRTLLGDHPIRRRETDAGTDADLPETLSTLEEVAAIAEICCMATKDRPLRVLVGKGSKYTPEVIGNAVAWVRDTNVGGVLDRMGDLTHRRRMVVSQKGYIGLAPLGTRIGDHICVLHGGEMPFILREHSGNDSSDPVAEAAEDYVLVGEAYVHGLMHGEAVTAADAGELQRVHMILH